MDRTIKINDYVTHEKTTVKGDSSGNFTISPLGYPVRNNSRYGEEGGTIPTLFQPSIMALQASATTVSACTYKHLVNLEIDTIDSDNNLFEVDCSISALSTLAYSVVISDAQFIKTGTVYNVSIVCDEVPSITGLYSLTVQDGGYVITPKEGSIVSIETGTSVPAKISYIPTDCDIISLTSQTTSTENGMYKLYVDVSEITKIKWVKKGNNPTEGFVEGKIQMDGTENDNVGAVYEGGYDHYRKGKSDSEVSSYLDSSIDVVNKAGKFYGEQYNPNKHGMLVEWFLSDGEVNLSKNGKPIYVDAFGKIPQEAEIECTETTTNAKDVNEYLDVHNKQTNWILDTTGSDEQHLVHDWPYNAVKTYHNNITLSYKDNPQVGGRHNIVMRTDLKPIDGKISPRKTFIHLPTPLDLKDGYEYEFNISMPVTSVDPDIVSELTDKKLSGYTSYVSQPRAYIISGKQYHTSDNMISGKTLEISDSQFTFFTKNTIENNNIYQIAFSLYNKYACAKRFPFVGSVSYESTLVTKVSGTDDTIMYTKNVLQKYDGILLTYTSTTDKYSFTVIDVKSSSDGTRDVIKLSSPIPDGAENLMLLRSKVIATGKFPYNTKTREWTSVARNFTCMLNVRYLKNSTVYYEGLTERGNDSVFGTDPETTDIDTTISKYNQNFRIDATTYGKINADDKKLVIATVYPTATNTFSWNMIGRNKVKHLGLSTSGAVDYLILSMSSTVKPITRLVYENNKKIADYMASLQHYYPSADKMPVDYTANETCSVIGRLLRVKLPEDLTNVNDLTDEYYVVKQAKSAYSKLIRDLKISRIGYSSYTPNVKNCWFTADSHASGYINNFKELFGEVIEPYTKSGVVMEQKMNEWVVKLLHIPNSTLGVYPNSSDRNYDFAGFDMITYQDSFKVFYSSDIQAYLEGDNILYAASKTQTDTTQKYEETFSDYSILGRIPENPFNYTVQNSVLDAYFKDSSIDITGKYAAQKCSAVNGFMDIHTFFRGIRDIGWTSTEYAELSYVNEVNDMLYPITKVHSADGIVFPMYQLNSNMSSFLDDTATRKQMNAYPLTMMLLSELYGTCPDKLSDTDFGLISLYWKEYGTSKLGSAVTKYIQKLIPMAAQNMPHHLYNSRRINISYKNDKNLEYLSNQDKDYLVDDASHTIITENSTDGSAQFQKLLEPYAYRHEVSLYQERLKEENPLGAKAYMKMHINDDFLITEDDTMETGEVRVIDPNMDYVLLDQNTQMKNLYMPATLSSGADTASSSYIKERFGKSFTRIHVTVVFSSDLGRWVVKDYYQIPTNYLTPLYGAETLGYMESSYKTASTSGKFDITKCQKEYLWMHDCMNSVDYKNSMNTLYSEQSPLEMNTGCIPFLLDEFPYDDDGKYVSKQNNYFKNLYASIKVPMNAYGTQIGSQTPGVNFWSLKWNVRPARSVYPGADIPSLSTRTDTTGNISLPTLGCFTDISDTSPHPEYITPTVTGYNLITESSGQNLLYEEDVKGKIMRENMPEA